MRQHRLALCKDHYIDWFIEQTQRFIEKYQMFTQNEPVLVAVSGGKDSLALWDVLHQLEYSVEGLYIDLGIERGHAYSLESKEYCQKFAKDRGLTLHIVDIPKEHNETVPMIAQRTHRGQSKPCAVCGLVKRHDLNQAALDLGFPVLATAHNLDDEVSFLFGNTLSWNISQLARQSPVLPGKEGFVRKVKPFIRFTERETAAYTIVCGMEYVEEECPFAEGSKQILYKNLLNQLEEEQPGVKLRFLVGFLSAREQGLLQPIEGGEAGIDLRPCPACGQLTSTGGLCAYCKLFAY